MCCSALASSLKLQKLYKQYLINCTLALICFPKEQAANYHRPKLPFSIKKQNQRGGFPVGGISFKQKPGTAIVEIRPAFPGQSYRRKFISDFVSNNWELCITKIHSRINSIQPISACYRNYS